MKSNPARMLSALILSVGLCSCESDEKGAYVSVGNVVVSSRVQGVRYAVPAPGTYRFTIIKGAYSTGSPAEWTTVVVAYADRPVETALSPSGRPHPTNRDGSVGNFEPVATASEAADEALGDSMVLDASEYVMLIVPDDFGTFVDNKGSMTLLVERRQ